MTQELIDALVGLLQYAVSPVIRKASNPYTQRPIITALKTLAKATGHSTFGYDYLDVLDKIKADQTTTQTTKESA